MTSRALALLAAFASPRCRPAAIAGGLSGAWPAPPLTLALSAFAVIGGPLLGILHIATSREHEEEPMLAFVHVAGRNRRIPLDAVSATPPLAAPRRFQNSRHRPTHVAC